MLRTQRCPELDDIGDQPCEPSPTKVTQPAIGGTPVPTMIDGVKHYTTDIIGEDMQMIGGSGGGERGIEQDRSRFGGGSRREPSADGKPTAGAQQAQRREKPAKPSFDDVPFDDDIPF